jgi:hypothetical protein
MGHDLASWAIEEDVRAPDRWAPSHSGGCRGELGHVGLGLGGPQPATLALAQEGGGEAGRLGEKLGWAFTFFIYFLLSTLNLALAFKFKVKHAS